MESATAVLKWKVPLYGKEQHLQFNSIMYLEYVLHTTIMAINHFYSKGKRDGVLFLSSFH